jgi:hypothetical protein
VRSDAGSTPRHVDNIHKKRYESLGKVDADDDVYAKIILVG